MEGSGDCQNHIFVAIATDAQLQPRGFATRLATIHNYVEGSLALPESRGQSSTSNTITPL